MKLIVRTIVFHMLCILIFSLLYFRLAESFENSKDNTKNMTFIDFFSLSVTIQSGVGLTYLDPSTFYSKVTVLLQQIILISTHVITLYMFTL